MSDYPREEALRRAEAWRATYGAAAAVSWRYTCQACGARCELPEPNVLPITSRCTACGVVTWIREANFAVTITQPVSGEATR